MSMNLPTAGGAQVRAGRQAEEDRAPSAVQRLAMVLQTLRNISAADWPWPEKLRELLDIGCSQLGLANGAVARVCGDEYEILEARSQAPEIERGRIYPLGDSLCRQVLSTRSMQVQELGGAARLHPAWLDLHAGSYIGVPIIVVEQPYGTLSFFSPESRAAPFSETECEIVKLMGQWLGGELARQQSQDELRKTISEMRILNSVVRAGSRSLRLEEVAHAMVAEIGAALEADVAVLLYRQGNGLRPIGIHPPDGACTSSASTMVPRKECCCGRAAQGEHVFAIELSCAAQCRRKWCEAYRLRSFAALPVRHGGRVLAVLGLGTRGRRDFSRQASFLETLVDHIGGALQSAILYEQGLYHIEQMEEKVCALQAAERRLRLSWFLLDNAGDGVFLFGRDGCLRQANKKAGMLQGGVVDELLGLSVTDIEPGMTPAVWREQWDCIKKSGAAVRQTVHVCRDGSTLPVEVRSTYLEYEGEGLLCAFVRDITEQLEAEKKRHKVAEQLLQAQKMECIGRLAGGIAHDFNNLLSGIIGYCELTLLSLEPEHPCYQKIKTIHKSGERAAALTRQLLSFSRKQSMNMAVTNLNVIIENLVSMATRLIGEDVLLEIRLHKPLKNINGDAGQIEQILLNLVINARDAMPAGGRLEISTGEERVKEPRTTLHGTLDPGAYVTLEVRDTGHGIDHKDLPRIFEPFFTTKEVDKGTGLGLATVYALVGLHKGHVEVESETGAGTRFRLYFPGVERFLEPVPPAMEKQRLAGGREVVLLVDDEQVIRQLLVDILDPLGYSLVVAASGDEALRAAAELDGQLRLLLTDVVMPHMGGLELAQRLRAQNPDIKVLFMSGFLESDIPDFAAIGGPKLLRKPVTPRQLASAIRNLLDEEG